MSTKRFQQLIPSLHNGISRQAPPIRFTNQVSDGENVLFSILDGALKRPGNRYHSHVTINKGDCNYRMHKVQRDQDEKYLFIYGNETGGMSLRVMQTFNPRNRQQWITIVTAGAVVGGKFKLVFGTQTTTDISYNTNTATMATNIQSALEAVTNVGTFGVGVAHSSTTATEITWKATFIDTLTTANLLVPTTGSSLNIEANVSVIGTFAKVVFGTGTQTYLNSGTPSADNIKLLTVTDTTIICNSKVATGTLVLVAPNANTSLDPAKMPIQAQRTSLSPPTFTLSQIAWPIAPPAWREQKVYVSLASGTFTLMFGSQTTTALAFNCTSADMRNALVALNNIGATDIDVIKVDNVYSVFFTNSAGTLTGSGLLTSNQATTVTISSSEEQSTAPEPIVSGDFIVDIVYHRGRIGFALGEWVVFSQPDDLFNFFPEVNGSVSDADSIALQIGADTVSLITSIVPFRKGILVLTEGGRQFDLGSGDIFNAETASFTPSTQYTTQKVKPAVTGRTIYFAGVRESCTPIWEYAYDDVELTNKADEISSHVTDLIPKGVKTLVASDNNNMVFVLPSLLSASNLELQKSTATGGNWSSPESWASGSVPGTDANVEIVFGATITFDNYPQAQSNTVYVYRQYVAGEDKVQSAWSVYTFGTDNISDIAIIDDNMWSCRVNTYGSTNQLIVDSMPISPIPSPPAGFPFQPRLDHRYVVKGGTYASLSTTYSLMVYDPLVTTATYVDAGGLFKEVTVVNTSDNAAGTTTVTVTGDTRALLMTFGRSYDMMLELSQIFAKDGDKNSIIDGHVELSKVVVSHAETGIYKLSSKIKGGTIRSVTHYPDTVGGIQEILSQSGRSTSWLNGRSIDNVISIESRNASPVRITSVEYHGRQTIGGVEE